MHTLQVCAHIVLFVGDESCAKTARQFSILGPAGVTPNQVWVTKEGIKIRSLFRNSAVFYWHTLACVGSLLALSYKQLRSRNHRHSQRTCGACPRGVSAYYTFCESHGWGTLCTCIYHPTFSLHIPQPRLGEIRQWKDCVFKWLYFFWLAQRNQWYTFCCMHLSLWWRSRCLVLKTAWQRSQT
jgi:hypothetical protein